MRILIAVFILLFCGVSVGFSQKLIKPHYGAGTPEVAYKYTEKQLPDGEIVPYFEIEEVLIRRLRPWTTAEERLQYLRLRRNVLRVLPYAIYAQKRYAQLDKDLAAAAGRREEKSLIKECEQEIKHKITSEVKNLSVSQGKILIKLIERQTGSTSYELVKEMKGNVTAFLYQGVARIFGHNLKSTYNPQEDRVIESIIEDYERARPVRTQ